MNAIATKVLEVKPGSLRYYHGTYRDYLWAKERAAAEAAEAASARQSRSKIV